MAVSILLADASFLVALLDTRDGQHGWAVTTAARLRPPWRSCEAAISETFFLLGRQGSPQLVQLLRRGAVVVFDLAGDIESVLALMQKYSDVPMSLADACLVRMTEMHTDPLVITTDFDFRIYRRHGRRVVPCVLPD